MQQPGKLAHANIGPKKEDIKESKIYQIIV